MLRNTRKDQIEKKLSVNQRERISYEFREYVGSVINTRRIKKNISQTELGEFVNKSKASISGYENGKKDMVLSTLGLICYYLDLPFFELFPRSESQQLMAVFDEMVKIDMEPPRVKKESKKVVIGHVVYYDGHEAYEPVISKSPLKKSHYTSFLGEISKEREVLRSKIYESYALPFTDETMREYLFHHNDLYDLLFASFLIIQQTYNKKATSLRRQLAKFVIKEFLNSDKLPIQQLRLREYYLAIVEEHYLKSN